MPVVVASWLGGVVPGIVAAIVGSALYNVGFLPPYGTFDLERTEYVVAFFAFIAMSLLISWLVGVAHERATAAEDREAEVRLLFDLSHVLVSERRGGPHARRSVARPNASGSSWPRSATRTIRPPRRRPRSRCGSARRGSARWSSSGIARR